MQQLQATQLHLRFCEVHDEASELDTVTGLSFCMFSMCTVHNVRGWMHVAVVVGTALVVVDEWVWLATAPSMCSLTAASQASANRCTQTRTAATIERNEFCCEHRVTKTSNDNLRLSLTLSGEISTFLQL